MHNVVVVHHVVRGLLVGADCVVPGRTVMVPHALRDVRIRPHRSVRELHAVHLGPACTVHVLHQDVVPGLPVRDVQVKVLPPEPQVLRTDSLPEHDPVRSSVVIDYVIPVPGVENIGVVPGPAVQGVVSFTPIQKFIHGSTIYGIHLITANYKIVCQHIGF